MGNYRCEFGVVHKTCRCRLPHTIKCDVPQEHDPKIKECLVLTMKRDGRLDPLGKHEAHPPHEWWASSYHQMNDDFVPSEIYNGGWTGYDMYEGNCAKWKCPGRD